MESSLGIEIGERYLKLAALKPQGSVNFIVETISDMSDDRIVKAVSSSYQKLKFRPRKTVLCLPRNLTTVKNLSFPSQDAKEVEQMMDLHIARLVPYRKEEILYGHRFLGINASGYANELLAIVHRDITRRQFDIVERAGLSIDEVSLSSYGAWQWTLANFKSEMTQNDPYLLLEIDATFTDLIIFNSENLLFSRSIAVEVGKDGLGPPETAKLINEIRQSLIIFYNEALNKKPMAIFLAGASGIGDLYVKLKNEFDIPVKNVPSPDSKAAGHAPKIDIPRNVSLGAVSELMLEDKPDRIFFILPELQARNARRKKIREFVILGAFFIYLFACILAVFAGRLYNQRSYLRQLDAENELITKEVGAMMGQAQGIEAAREILHERKKPFFLLHALQKTIAPEVALNYINLDEDGSMTLRGRGTRLSDVFEFVTLLEKSNYFKDVLTKYTRAKKIKEKDVTDFELTLKSAI